MDNIDDIIIGLFFTLSRVNMVIGCLPSYVQDDMEDVKVDIISTPRNLECNVSMDNNDRIFIIDMVTMYNELKNISNKLEQYMLAISDLGKDTNQLEDAIFSIKLIIKTIAEHDSVFRGCYQGAKKKVLK